MKEVKYDGDLESDINSINKTLGDTTDKNDIIVLGIIVGLFIANFAISSFFPGLALISLCIALGSSLLIAVDSYKKKIKSCKAFESSVDNLCSLSNELNKSHNIKMGLEDIRKSVQNSKSEGLKDDNCKVNQSTNFFYILDKNEQIQVLKQIRTQINKKQADIKLLLLEQDDLKNIEIPKSKILKLTQEKGLK